MSRAHCPRLGTTAPVCASLLLLASWTTAADPVAWPSGADGRAPETVARPGAPAAVFVENRGQYPAEVRFVGRTSDAALLVTDDGVVFQSQRKLPRDARTVGRRTLARPSQRPLDGVNVHLRWGEAITPVGEDGRAGRVNYFRGADPSAWVTDVPTWSSLRVERARDGSSLVLRLVEGGLDVVVEADGEEGLASFAWSVAGAGAVSERGGVMVAETHLGTMRLGRLVGAVGADVALVGGRASGTALTPSPPAMGSLGPFPEYSTYVGGSGDERIRGLANDPGGSAFKVLVSGYTTSSVIYPAPPGPYTTFQGAEDVFVAKLPKQSGLMPDFVWASYIGGASLERGQRLAVDAAGGAYVVGYTFSPDFPTTAGAVSTSINGGNPNGNPDGFALRLSPFGWIQYSTFLGDDNIDAAFGVDVDAAGNAYVCGQTDSPDFPTTPGALSETLNGDGIWRCVVPGTTTLIPCPDSFVTKLDPAGALVYSTFVSGIDGGGLPEGAFQDQALDLAVDGAGRVHVVTITNSPVMPVTANAFQPYLGNDPVDPENRDDGHLATLDAAGATLLHGTFLGGVKADGANAVAVHPTGNEVFIAGGTQSCDFPVTAGAFDTTLGVSGCPGADAAVSVLDWTSGALLFSSFLGGDDGDIAWDVATDDAGRAHVVGFTDSPDFPTTSGVWDTSYNRRLDAYVSVFSADGSTLESSTYFGARGDDAAYVLSLGPTTGWVHFAGDTTSPTFPLSIVPLDGVFDGPTEAFVAALDMP